MNSKISLSETQIEDILDFFKPNPFIPKKTALSVVEKIRNDYRDTLKKVKIYPSLIPVLKEQLRSQHMSSLITPGESVGIITAQCIGEQQTQTNLSSFHKAGSSEKQPTVSMFAELLNATNKPKAPSFLIFFRNNNTSVLELREMIGNSLVQIDFRKITKKYSVSDSAERPPWHEAFGILYGKEDPGYTACLTLDIDVDVLYEYKLTLQDVCNFLEQEYSDMYCVFSPDCFHRIDIYADTSNIELPEEYGFITPENIVSIYLEEVVKPVLQGTIVCGIPGILAVYYNKVDKEWCIESENSVEKTARAKFRNAKATKPIGSVMRYKHVLALDFVDFTRTISNNVWDIYYTLGVEATRAYMLDKFCKIMPGINKCHFMCLVDKMLFTGKIASVSRYTMRSEGSDILGKATFEESVDNFLNGAVSGVEEIIKGASASIICGKRGKFGTGMCDMSLDLEKMLDLLKKQK